MTPFHFGDSGEELLGTYHPPGPGRKSAGAVLLCNPFGQEAIRAHRTFRVLAERLASNGHPVLRFDYFGTGDSAGSLTDVQLGRWIGDIQMAARELQDMSGAPNSVWIGLGMGATLATLAASSGNPTALVLWEPIVSGQAYLQALSASHKAMLAEDLGSEVLRRRRPGSEEPWDYHGFKISARLHSEISSICLPNASTWRPMRSALLTTRPEIVQSPEIAALAASDRRFDILEATDSALWDSDVAMNNFVVPMVSVDAIVRWVA